VLVSQEQAHSIEMELAPDSRRL